MFPNCRMVFPITSSTLLSLILSIILIWNPSTALELDPKNTLIVLDPSDSGYRARDHIRLAFVDFVQDWYKVFGFRPPVSLTTEPALPSFFGTKLYLGKAATDIVNAADSSDEAHAIVVREADNSIFLTGNGNRGEVYALYSFCEEILNVNPTYFFTNAEPVYLSDVKSITVETIQFAAPAFKWRGIFPNDEDLLGNFSPDPMKQSMFSMSMWNRILEVLLRLKGNLVITGTVSFPDEAHYDLVKMRGVAVTEQHFTLLGVNTWRWPEGIPYSFNLNPEVQNHVWNSMLDTYSGRESVWTIGYRGLNDYPFWVDEPTFNTTESQCKLINAAMQQQADIVRNTPGRENDKFVTYMWAEMLDLYLTGGLVLPDDTILVFADAGGSGEFDPSVFDMIGPGDGVYYHIQMEFPGWMSQLTEMVPPSVFYDQVSKIVEKGATEYFMLNLSDLKPAAFTFDLVMRFLWDPSEAIERGGEGNQAIAVKRWVESNIRDEAFVDDVSKVIKDYFEIDYIKAAGDKDRWGDEHLPKVLRQLAVGTTTPEDAQAFIKVPIKQLQTLHDKASDIYARMDEVDSVAKVYFRSSWLLHVSIHHYLLQAIDAASKNDFDAAIGYVDQVQESMKLAEKDTQWSGLYGADRLLDLYNMRCLLQHGGVDIYNKEHLLCNLPNGNAFNTGTGKWSDWYDYAATSDNYPYLNKPADEDSLDYVVRVKCSEEGGENGGCTNTPVGGSFNGTSARVTMALGINAEQQGNFLIRFTVDGSDVDGESTIFDGRDIVITETTQINALVIFEGGSKFPTITTRPLFTKIETDEKK